MASSLTIEQKIALFQALEVPFATSYNTVSEIGSLSAATSVAAAGQSAAQTAITTWLDTLSSTNGETQLITLLNRWIAIGTKVASISTGSIGEMQGLSMDYRDERSLIAGWIKIIVPFYKFHEVLAKQMGGGNSFTIPIMR